MERLVKSENEIDKQMDLADLGRKNGSKYPGMSYEDGIIAALEWALGVSSDAPMED